MYRCAARSLIGAIVAIVALGLVASAAAQLRAFPQHTLRGTLVFGEYPAIVLNGKSRTPLRSVGIGFIATRATSGSPVVMPPSRPPAWFVARPKRPNGPSRATIGSWYSEPGRRA